MSFLKRKKAEPAPPPPPTPVVEEVTGQQYALKLAYMARSSDGLRMTGNPAVVQMLPQIVEPLSDTPIEIIEPLPLEYSDATPAVERFNEMQQWVLARRDLGPIAQHALYALQMTDAHDVTVYTFFSCLLHGATNTS